MGAFISWINKNADTNNSGEAIEDEKNQPPSLSGMVSTLVPVLIVALVYFLIFLILRRSKRRFYAPRTYLGSLREFERSPDLPNGWFNWIGAFWKVPDAYALQHQSLDAYLFIRYLRVLTGVCFASLCITWPILFPINATGGNGAKELEVLSYSNINISGNGKHKLFAHCLTAFLIYGFLMYTIVREMIYFINVRQAFLLAPQYAKRISSRTVLFTSVPEEYQDEARIRQMFSDSVKNVWLVGDTTDLDKLIEERDETAMKLEKGEVKLLKLVNKERVKAAKKGGSDNVDNGPSNGDAEHGSIAARWIPNKKRPSHRLGPLGLIGKKVDTIEWGREELHRIVPQAETAQVDFKAGNFKKLPAVFVEFHTQSDAQAAYQVLTHHQALRMSPRYIGVQPGEVVWKSLAIPWWQLVVRKYIVVGIISVLIIFWAIPVGIVGIVAKVDTLKTLPGMSWIDKIPSVILGVISGLLPSVALSILMSLVPVIMRILAKKAGCPSMSEVELYTQKAYFVFQLIQVFLIQSLTSTASQLIVEIAQNPTDIFGKLAEYIPQTSNFYISYFIVQGLTIAMGVLTQVVGCVIFQLLYRFAGTPRAMYTKWTTLSSLSWGSLMPVYTNIAVISITYSVIAPLMLFWSTLAMTLFHLAYKYNVIFVSSTQIDTRGLIYPRALKQLLSGIYIGEGVMIGMFIVSKAAGPAVLMALFLILTILVNLTISSALDPLLYSLPRSLQIEEELLQRSEANSELEDGQVNGTNGATNGTDHVGKRNGAHKFAPGGKQGVQKDGNFVMKWLKPWIYADYETFRKLVPQESQVGSTYNYTEEVNQNAYWPPSATSQTPILWIPEDVAGVSKQEVALTSKVIPITDEGCTLNDKNRIEWDTEGARPPIWEEKIYY